MPSDNRPAILVVDDEPDLREALTGLLATEYDVRVASDAEKALERLRAERFQCVLLDLSLPGMDGFEFLARLRDRDLRVPVIVLTGRKTVKTAVEAMQLGAENYITKPWNPEELRLAIARAVERARLSAKVEAYESAGEEGRTRFEDIVTTSARMRAVVDLARRMCDNDARVMITGETGTGKELLAHAIHDNGDRRSHGFVAVNCAAIPTELAESEFFGHEKGAFTGAIRSKKGKFELAHQGTLFLDEVTCLSLDLQAKLLRVLQDGKVDRVGGEAPFHVDARVVAATNLDPRAEVQAGRFREDLYYRLNVVPLEIPPLRERRDDISILLDHFRTHVVRRMRKNVTGYTAEARRLLCAYDWPGNVRELEHTVERLVVLERGLEIGVDHMPVDIVAAGEVEQRPSSSGEMLSLKSAREQFERKYIVSVLVRAHWNQTRAAVLLGINRNTLIAKMQQYGLKTPAGARGMARKLGTSTL